MTRKNLNPGCQQINLDGERLSRNKTFVREIGNLGLTEGRYLFERLNRYESPARQNDPTMTLDGYLSLMTRSSWVILQARSDSLHEEISLAVTNVYRPGDRASNLFLWYLSKYTNENLSKVKGLFERVYGRDFPST